MPATPARQWCQNDGAAEKKYLSPVTMHLLEAALPALAFAFSDEGLANRIAGATDEHPRWLQWRRSASRATCEGEEW